MAQVSDDQSLSVSGESEPSEATVLGYPRLWEPDNAGVPVLLILDLQADCAL
jgi:hypothetical protein